MQFLGAIKKVGCVNTWRQNAKWRKTPTDFNVNGPKYVQIPIFGHIPRAHEHGQISIYGFTMMGKICHGKKFLGF